MHIIPLGDAKWGSFQQRGSTDDVWEVSPKADGVGFGVPVVNPILTRQ